MIGHIGKHRRSVVPLRLVVFGALYVGVWAAYSAYATVVMSR